MNEKFKRIDLNDPSTFEMISVNDKIVYEDDYRKEEVRALVVRKKKKSFEAIYRRKNTHNGNMISIDEYYLLEGDKIYNFGPDRNYSEKSMRDKLNYFILDEKLKQVGI